MKKLLFVILALALFSTMFSTPCIAANKEWSAVLGFAGGFLTAQVMNGQKEHFEHRNYYHCQPYQKMPMVYHSPVIISQPPIYPQPVYVVPVQQGHWEYIEERVYVPGTWVYQQISPNTYQKIWQDGYYKVIVKKIWVNN